MIGSKILFAYRKRLINVRLDNYLEIISVFDIVFLSQIAYTINTQKSPKRGGVSMATSSTVSYTHLLFLLGIPAVRPSQILAYYSSLFP